MQHHTVYKYEEHQLLAAATGQGYSEGHSRLPLTLSRRAGSVPGFSTASREFHQSKHGLIVTFIHLYVTVAHLRMLKMFI